MFTPPQQRVPLTRTRTIQHIHNSPQADTTRVAINRTMEGKPRQSCGTARGQNITRPRKSSAPWPRPATAASRTRALREVAPHGSAHTGDDDSASGTGRRALGCRCPKGWLLLQGAGGKEDFPETEVRKPSKQLSAPTAPVSPHSDERGLLSSEVLQGPFVPCLNRFHLLSWHFGLGKGTVG